MRRFHKKDRTTERGTRTIVLRAFMAVLTVILIAGLFTAKASRADDRKTRVITFLSSGAYTAATGYSTAFDVSAYTEGQLFVDVTVRDGSSTLDITIQTSPNNSTWYTHTTVAQISATGQTRAAITNFGNYVRIKYIVGVTSMTYSVSGVLKN